MSLEERLPDFAGMSVIFYVAGQSVLEWMSDGVVLESPVFEIQAGRTFVVGQTPLSDGNDYEWAAGRRATLSWEDVMYYIAIPTDEYRELDDEPDILAG